MDKIITTTLLIMAGVVCMIFVFNSVFPMVNRSSQAIVSMADDMNDRLKTRVSIVHAAATADRKTVYVWIKNTGSSRIANIEQSDLFLGQEGNFLRVPYSAYAGSNYPRWEYEIENDTEWLPTSTIKITVTYDTDPGTGQYFVKIVIPNGTEAEYYFSM